MSQTEAVQAVVEKWFGSLTKGDIESAISCLADDIEWINMQPVKGISDVLPWIGTCHGIEKVSESFKIYLGVVDVKLEESGDVVVQGNQAVGKIHEIGTVKATGRDFEINFVTWLDIDPSKGKIVRWKSYTDPSPILAAFGVQRS